MERRGRLTYERLHNSLERLQNALQAQISDPKGSERAQDLQSVIQEALDAARAGLSGTGTTSPIDLKREIEARIAEVHKRHNEIDEPPEGNPSNAASAEKAGPSALADLSTAPNTTPLCTSAPFLNPDSGKENTTPLTTQLTPAKKPSAVRKTAIKKRATTKTTPTPTTTTKSTLSTPIKKRSCRTLRSKTALPPIASQPTTATEVDGDVDEAQRRAAATALLGLGFGDGIVQLDAHQFVPAAAPKEAAANTSTLSTSKPSTTTPNLPSQGKKRAREDALLSASNTGGHEGEAEAELTRAAKRRALPSASGARKYEHQQEYESDCEFKPLPVLHEWVSVSRAFEMGVQYACECVREHEGFGDVGAGRGGLVAFVGKELERRANGFEVAGGVQGEKVSSSTEMRRGGDGGRGFWDVV